MPIIAISILWWMERFNRPYSNRTYQHGLHVDLHSTTWRGSYRWLELDQTRNAFFFFKFTAQLYQLVALSFKIKH